MNNFNIRALVDFDSKGRAQCPVCLTDGKKGKNLSVMQSGAYKCFRGCTPDEIRTALGTPKSRPLPPSTTHPTPPPKNVLLNPQKVKAATDKLLSQNKHALEWLEQRGITREMVAHYRLGVVRTKVGDNTKPSGSTHLPAIAIAIPNVDGTCYFHKKRVRPWVSDEDQPDGYRKWSQYGIPAMTYTTHQPDSPEETWLCEGEWDAIVLGWAVHNNPVLKDRIQVSCFTCGAGNIPPEHELAKLNGQVFTWFDRDQAGLDGAKKLQGRLKDQVIICQVPAPEDQADGWDVSDAIAADMFTQLLQAREEGIHWSAPKPDNPLRDRVVTNDEMLAAAPDFTDWLVDEILTADEMFVVAAPPRAGKSLLAFTLTHAVASGGKFLGRPVSQGGVLYVRCEDSDSKAKERELKQGWGEGLPVYWLEKFKLSELDHLRELVEELNIRLVVFDTLSRIRDSSIGEGSAEMSQLLEPVQDMCKELRCCALLVHHTGKINIDNAATIDIFDTIRGSSAIRATCRGALILAAGDRSYRLHVENGWGKLDLQVLLDANTLNWRLMGNWLGPQVDQTQRDRVLEMMTKFGSATLQQIADTTNLPRKCLYEVLKRLCADDLVEKRGNRKNAVYYKTPIQHIQQLNTLLNSSKIDTERDREPIQQKSNSGGAAEKVILNPKSDPSNKEPLMTDDDHFSKNDHFFAPHSSKELLNREPEPNDDKEYGYSTPIQHNSTRTPENRSNPDESSDTAYSTKTPKVITFEHLEGWVLNSELNTPVLVVRAGKRKSEVKIPGVGVRSVSNKILTPLPKDGGDCE